ncbi:MAG: Uma2 family endonuclease [Sphingobacteriaceae bacterium]|nr:Uma2 family endonuclease [Cytophagaceae bacterium]
MLLAESDVWLTQTQKRIPDVAFFTAEQITRSVTEPEPIPSWIIEFISPGDPVKKVEENVLDYFTAGVQVVWHVHPALRMVRVLTSTRHATTYFENDPLPAPPALPDLSLTVGELFTP